MKFAELDIEDVYIELEKADDDKVFFEISSFLISA